MSERDESAAIAWRTADAGDGHASFGYGSAKVRCPECDGWEGTSCPHGCGVHLVSTQAAKDAECAGRMRAEDAERRARRHERTNRQRAR